MKKRSKCWSKRELVIFKFFLLVILIFILNGCKERQKTDKKADTFRFEVPDYDEEKSLEDEEKSFEDEMKSFDYDNDSFVDILENEYWELDNEELLTLKNLTKSLKVVENELSDFISLERNVSSRSEFNFLFDEREHIHELFKDLKQQFDLYFTNLDKDEPYKSIIFLAERYNEVLKETLDIVITFRKSSWFSVKEEDYLFITPTEVIEKLVVFENMGSDIFTQIALDTIKKSFEKGLLQDSSFRARFGFRRRHLSQQELDILNNQIATEISNRYQALSFVRAVQSGLKSLPKYEKILLVSSESEYLDFIKDL